MLTVYDRYENKNGIVVLLQDSSEFLVHIEHYDQTGILRFHSDSFRNFEQGLGIYKDCIAFLNGKTPSRKCVAHERGLACSAKNCSKKIGNVSFWNMFRDKCKYRTR